jgi:hypothetical protein
VYARAHLTERSAWTRRVELNPGIGHRDSDYWCWGALHVVRRPVGYRIGVLAVKSRIGAVEAPPAAGV